MIRYIALFWLICLIIMGLFGAQLAPYDPMMNHSDAIAQKPSTAHLLGTDGLGRDILSRLLAGANRTLGFSALSTLITIIIGAGLGMSAPILGKWGDGLLVLMMNTLLALPSLFTALLILTLLGRGDTAFIMAVAVGQIGTTAHVMRGATYAILNEDYITSARSMGATWWWIIGVHIRRGIIPTLGAQIGIVFGYCLFNGAALNFLGLGVTLGVPEWGAMLAEGRAIFRTAPHLALFTGLLLMSVIVTINTLIDEFFG